MNFDFWGAGLFTGAAICFSLVACGGDDSNSASNPTKETVASTDNLGICSEDVCNQKVFVEEDSAYFVCDGEKWIEEMSDDDEDSVSVTDPESSVKSSSSSVDVPPSSAPKSSAESSSSGVGDSLSSAPKSSAKSSSSIVDIPLSSAPKSSAESSSSGVGDSLSSASESSAESSSSSVDFPLSSAPESSSESSSSSVDFPLSSAPESSSESSSSSVDFPLSSTPESSSSEKVAWAYLNPEISYGLMQDSRDGQYYKTVKIGEQVWMAENLNYDPGDVSSMGSYATNACYGNKPENCAKYGRLYTWEVAMNDRFCTYGLSCKPSGTVRGLCPEGWHLPSFDEFVTLLEPMASTIEYDDGGSREYDDAGKKLKSQTGWKPSSFGASYSQNSNESGFTALPAGGFDGMRNFSQIETHAFFWSASEYKGKYDYEENVAFGLELNNTFYVAYLSFQTKTDIASVRCIQNTR